MFGIANQLLAVMALAVCSVILVKTGKGRYVWVTALPMGFVAITTTTAAAIMLTRYARVILDDNALAALRVNAGISGALILGIVTCTAIILIGALLRVLKGQAAQPLGPR